MASYESFAQVYDMFMDNVPYETWCDSICTMLGRYGVKGGLLLDLGCGTGTMTELMAERGFDCIGVDLSADMLEIAREKQEKSGHDILYLQQDMRELELYGTVGTVISICDSINYILERVDLVKVFELVNNYLDPGGIFLFDLNTRYKYEQIMGDCVIAENREEGSFIWENTYYEEEQINEYDLTIFKKEKGDLYRRYQETHFQRAWDFETVCDCLREAGLTFLEACDENLGKVHAKSERIYILAGECKKQ